MPRRPITQKQLDLISNYLANDAEKDILSQEYIDAYREAHKNRLKWGNKSWSAIGGRHPHKNNPYCNICDEDLEPGDFVYIFMVRATLIYHVECFDNTRVRKQLSIIYQDRVYQERKKREQEYYEKHRNLKPGDPHYEFFKQEAERERRKRERNRSVE